MWNPIIWSFESKEDIQWYSRSQTLTKSGRGSGVLSNISCHMGWAMFYYNCILDLELKVSDASVHMDYCTAPCTKARDGCRVYRDRQNSLRDKYSLPPIRFKIHCLHHTSIIKSSARSRTEIGPAPCDKKCCSEHQTFFACAEGLGTRLIQR